MFYCEQCKEKNKWPTSLHRSFGHCEMCGKIAHCYDVKSHNLPNKQALKEAEKP